MEPYTIVLTQEMANKFFPDEDPIGRTLTVEHRYFRGDYKITGVLENIPINSTIQFDCLASSASSEWIKRLYKKYGQLGGGKNLTAKQTGEAIPPHYSYYLGCMAMEHLKKSVRG